MSAQFLTGVIAAAILLATLGGIAVIVAFLFVIFPRNVFLLGLIVVRACDSYLFEYSISSLYCLLLWLS